MSEYGIRDKCYVNTNRGADTFVGIICDKGDFSVHFPLGFHVSEDDRELRKDIILLVATIGATIGHKESGIQKMVEDCDQTGFPIKAYFAVIFDYFERGYYREREVEYIVSKKGKINWSRTIKTQRPVIQDDDVYYFDFVTRRNTVNENQLITLIHEYCVAESFEKIGWLFTDARPQKPRIKCNQKLFRFILKEKMSRTFNDKNKTLFNAMLQIVDNLQDEDAPLEYKYGTYRFEYVWEALIDRVYGIEGKDKYFPKTTWKVKGKSYDNASLEPDTIMLYGNDIYVLDAKYYKFGETGHLGDLPESTSINKQITYGEYVANNLAQKGTVYNAFIMPFDSFGKLWNGGTVVHIGEATGNWRENNKSYERIQGILVDVKYLMNITVREESREILRLSECITKAVEGSFKVPDVLTPEQRRKNMQHIRGKDTKIEVILRRSLWAKGYRFRKNYKMIPGSPDIALTKYKIAVFCDGEFFHGKDWEVLKPRLEKSNNSEFWISKISRNRERDDEINKKLLFMGWTVIRFWGSDIKKNTGECIRVIEETIFDLKLSQKVYDEFTGRSDESK